MKTENKYTGISNGKIYDLQNVNFDTMNGLCDVEGYNRPQWCLFEQILPSDSDLIISLKYKEKLNTPLAQSANATVLLYKEHATPNQLEQMQKQIKVFDTDLNGCGFDAIQAKLKLEGIRDLTLPEFKAICQLFKD